MVTRCLEEGLVTHSDPSIRAAFQKACRIQLTENAEFLAQKHRQQDLLIKLLTLSHED
jgi:hypothetical protein